MGNTTLDRRALEHRTVAITGRLASMSREEAARRLAEAGAVYVPTPTSETDLLVVGQGGPPLGEDGRLTKSLRLARDLQEAGARIEIVAEEEWLARLGVEGFDLDRLYTTEQLGRILSVPRHQIRAWVRQGLIRPAQERHRLALFGFRQVASARALVQLARAGVTPARVRRSLEQLGRWFDTPEHALTQLEALEVGASGAAGAIGVRTEDGHIAEPSGQLRLGFDEAPGDGGEAGEAGEAGDAGASPRAGAVLPSALSPSPSTPVDDPFERGLDAEAEGRLEEAAEAYREAIEAGDARPEVAFNLGNALCAIGRAADAGAAFLRALEADPGLVEAWNNLGNVLDGLGRQRDAVLAYSRALAIAPDYVDAHYNLGDTLASIGDAVGARRHWGRYLEADPVGPTAAAVRERMAELGGG